MELQSNCIMLTWHQNSFHGLALTPGKREKKRWKMCIHSVVKMWEQKYLCLFTQTFCSSWNYLPPNHSEIYICLPNYVRHILQIQLIKSQPVVGVSLSAFHWFVFVYDVFCLLHCCDTFVQSHLAFRSSSYWSINAHGMKRNESFTHPQSFVSSTDWRVQ